MRQAEPFNQARSLLCPKQSHVRDRKAAAGAQQRVIQVTDIRQIFS